MYTEQKNKIIGFYKRHRRMPGYEEIMNLVGFKSKNAVYKLLNKLVDEGVVSKDSRGKIIPKNIFGEVPLLGLVEAGIPTVAEEVSLDTLSLDDYLIQHKDESFLLEVKGDSMINEGIKEGDLVLVEKKNTAENGDIVIALVDGGWTMKYLRKKGKTMHLEAANPKYKNIYPEYEFKIAAVVKGVIRKYE
jgi:SOS regulatory protein LexA